MTAQNEPDVSDARAVAADDRRRRIGYVIEAAIGLAIALLLLWVAVAAVTDVPFVYQGL